MSDIGPSPPWYVRNADGTIGDPTAIPDGLLHHPVLEQRGLASKLHTPLKAGCVYTLKTDPNTHPLHVVKILDPNTEEVAIQDRLLHEIGRPNNHTVPAEMIFTGHPLLIMPKLDAVNCIYPQRPDSLSVFVDIMFQMVEVA
ncbi:hypothetical protein TRAPUB_6764 [Trametes pubescens]|uniref:Protein kinase domain-containing protein n=1 Tax=Trametes pubescens TaxID=154538 RepID=A0A1M2V500_TRAPU|nr:hypothetical protein TRAPUB_6764 [Trametes pubescens]